MEIAQSIFDFFEIGILGEAATFTDLLTYIFQIGCSVWVVLFVFRCLFLAITLPNRGPLM